MSKYENMGLFEAFEDIDARLRAREVEIEKDKIEWQALVKKLNATQIVPVVNKNDPTTQCSCPACNELLKKTHKLPKGWYWVKWNFSSPWEPCFVEKGGLIIAYEIGPRIEEPK